MGTTGGLNGQDYVPALMVLLGVIITALIARLNVHATNDTTVAVTARTLEARWNERLEGLTEMQATNFGLLLERAGQANDRLLAEVEHQGHEIKDLRQTSMELQGAVKDLRRLLDECETRDAKRDVAEAERDARLGRMAREIRRLGGDPAC